MLTVALPKGRIADETLEIFSKIFDDKFEFEDRKLTMKKGNFEFLMVRNQDIGTYVTNGAADIGVVGLDVLEEHQVDVLRLLDLKLGVCKVCIGIKNNDTLDYSKPEIKIATKMPNITRNYFAKKATGVKIIKLYGSIELAPIVGLSDAIVDIVETGTTMKQNGLKVAETIMDSSAHLISNKNSFIVKREEIFSLYHKINAVINSKISLKSYV
ncbi:ATP phosphoribosyltransferase [Campylobacter hyointestinalis]|uniref:ATP phosphoribosyltransferase n=1 Tax=Campylobacter hyointestinalis TaxID=198 RepID=A0A562XCB3_CAMHY|nr:ATP phosphoribosyltransferase [Campylobacter hyointestinalis]ANE34004.1 ATP phosphoribosyltransferase HisG(S)Z, hetero-octameric short form, catalytic subunit [Campylobacter hyointestinalis subsp. lawsonii CCUG 27631]RAZ49474.1 ATP phosphoribosyltransferase [Campylobacter hyointestinalis subsp. lawsonii]RAZ52344.1 ATP phosphoribosyltransferase [Campylobacter hyointestinalis subsp. lawsonii]RAZ62614.1 ATP phosphoribosyltransferase [Campylobacter hyointestinalis subsp. lawsonii]TWO19655.1 ATP